jgi:hypothetical protein
LKTGERAVNTGPREFGKLKIYQSYSVGDPYRIEEEEDRDFSNITGELWWRFGPRVAARADTEWNPYTGDFYRLNGTLVVRDNGGTVFRSSTGTQRSDRGLNPYARVKTIEPLYLMVPFGTTF